jgi:hypothetical protein
MSVTKLLAGVIILAIIILLGVNCYNYINPRTVQVKSSIDNTEYSVQHDFTQLDVASNELAKLNYIGIGLLRALRNRYGAEISERGNVTRALLTNYNPDNLIEHSPKAFGNDTSYVVNKGSKFVMCLRDKQYNQFHDIDILTFVFLHEMTHLSIPDVDHNMRFWQTFKFLLLVAETANVYKSQPYTPQNNVIYCGLNVSYNPRYDDSLQDI